MDPNDQSRKRYDDFIIQRQQATTGVNNPQSKNRSPFNKFYAIGVIVGIIIILPAVFLLLRQNTYDGTSEIASTEGVTSTEISAEAAQMMGNTSDFQSNPEIIKRAKRNLLLKKAAKKLGVNSPQQIASNSNEPSIYAVDQLALEREVEKKVVTSRTVEFVSTYVIPTGNYKTVEATVKTNLEFIRQELLEGRSVTVAYANLVKKLGTDPGYNVVPNAYITPDAGYSSGFITALFKTRNGNVTSVIQSNGTDFMVAKTLNAVNTKFNSLSSWETATLK